MPKKKKERKNYSQDVSQVITWCSAKGVGCGAGENAYANIKISKLHFMFIVGIESRIKKVKGIRHEVHV